MNKRKNTFLSFVQAILRQAIALTGAACLVLVFFLVLPLMQTLSKGPRDDMVVRAVDTAKLEAPDPPPEPEPEEPEEQEEPPPELTEQAKPLDLNQLELALNPTFTSGFGGADFTVNLNTATANTQDVDALFSLADLDQKPRVVYQPGPRLTPDLKKRAPGKVYIIFIVNQDGRVVSPQVQSSTDSIFEKAALNAIKKWKFEPGKRNGQAVRFRMRVPIVFPKS